jgi:hypothetical protein
MCNQVLLVEDGSVDLDEIKEALPDIPVIVYRAGAVPPTFVDISHGPLFDGLAAGEPKPEVVERDSPATMERVWQAIKSVFDDVCYCGEEFNTFENRYAKRTIYRGDADDFIDEVRKRLGESK